MPNSKTVSELLTCVAGGDTQAFETLYRRFRPKLVRVCRNVLRDETEADDAVQDALVKVWLNAGQFDNSQTGEGWIRTIARNAALDRLRARKKVHLPVDDILGLPDQSPSPEAAAIVNNDNSILHGFLDRLDAGKAAAVRGAYLNGQTYMELATKHGVPLNTMRTWLRRSLIQLRNDLEKDDRGPT